MITGCLQKKNGYYYAVLYLKVNGKRKVKWIPTKLPIQGTSERKARKAFDEIRLNYEREEDQRRQQEADLARQMPQAHPEADIPFDAYLKKWIKTTRPSIAAATYQSYNNMLNARILPYFKELPDHPG